MKTFFGAVVHEYTNIKGRKNSIIVLPFAIYYYITHIGFRATTLVRYYNTLSDGVRKRHLRNKLCIKYGIEIGCGCRIGRNLEIAHIHGIVLGKKTIIGDNCKIYQQVTIGKKDDGYPIIGNNVTIYPGATVIGKIRVGDNAVIAPGAVVICDVPAGAVVGGVPAKILGR